MTPAPTYPPFDLLGPGARRRPRGRHWPFVTCTAPSGRALRAAAAGGAGGAWPSPPPPPPQPGASSGIFVKPAHAPRRLAPAAASAFLPPAWTVRPPSRKPDCTFQAVPGDQSFLPLSHCLTNSHSKGQLRGCLWEGPSDSQL